jgi:hypothetical protein
MPIALTAPQLDQIKTIAAQVPRHLRAQFLSRLAELLPPDMAMATCGGRRTKPCTRC